MCDPKSCHITIGCDDIAHALYDTFLIGFIDEGRQLVQQQKLRLTD